MKHSLPVVLIAGWLTACGDLPAPERLAGTWQMDSVVYYYNGFTYSDNINHRSGEMRYVFGEAGRFAEELDALKHTGRYILKRDSLVLVSDLNGAELTHKILRLTSRHLVLVCRKPGYFGETAEKFETLYLTRVE